MAQHFSFNGATLTIPGAYTQTTVQNNKGGIGTSGVVTILGEAVGGPDFSLETDLAANSFGPDQLSAVIAKYGSGNLVDAFAAASSPSRDPQVQGAPSKIYLVKTNQSTKASSAMARSGMSDYHTLADVGYGDIGNNIYYSIVDSVAEVAPTTGPATFIPTPSGASIGIRVNGGALLTKTITALDKVDTTVGAITTSATGLNSLSGVLATGGVNRGVITGLTGASSLAVSASGNNIVITLSGAATSWPTIPTAGDTLLIPGANGDYGALAGSVIKGAASANAGAYVVTAATALTITATKLRNNAAGALTPPVSVGAQAISGTPANDLLAFSPVSISVATGKDRGMLAAGNVGVNVTGTYASGKLTITLASGTWAATPQVGDLFLVPATAPAAIATAAGGWYTVDSATSSTVVLVRVSTDRVAASFVGTALAATTDLQCLRPGIDGLSKCLEIQDNTGTDNISTLFYALSSTPVTWISTSSTPSILRGTDQKIQMTVQRNSDSVNEVVTAGGEIAMKIGYKGTTASLTISSTTISSTVTGGLGANFSLSLSGFRTINDLVAKINSLTGYVAAVGTSLYGQLPVTALDQGTWSICSTNATVTVGIKKDAYEFFKQVGQSSSHVQLGATSALNVKAASGLPDKVSTTFLAGGALGGTTAAQMSAAFLACEKIRTNFVVSCFSRDASDDIADDLTDSSSTYQVDAVNALMATHCAKMSTTLRRRPRQGFVSKRTTFLGAKEAAANLASALIGCAFQDIKNVGVDGAIHQYQPWYGAVLAAGMQAAAFYRPAFNKTMNMTGALQAAGDFSDSDETAITEALDAGLIVYRQSETGGFTMVSDQTTYSVDENFVYNSFQAVYGMNIIAQTLQTRLEKAFVGQSFADVSASLVIGFVKGVMTDLKRLKLITGSDAAPEGYANLVVVVSAPSISVELSVVEATGVMFVPISVSVQAAQQTANG